MNIIDVATKLRGLTFQDTAGSIVHYANEIKSPDLICDFNELDAKFKNTHRSVRINDIGDFLIGRDYDDACSGNNNAPVKQGRNAVINNHVCVVTGGAQGFGEGIVRGLVHHGGIVFIADINLEGAEALAKKLNEEHKRSVAFGIECDVTCEESVMRMVEKIVYAVGGIDIFISNAGVLKAGSVKTLSKSDFELVTNVNYMGFFLCTKHVSPIMEKMHSSSKQYTTNIINIASKSALEGSNKNGAYAGSKFGAIGLTQSFAKELISDGIKVNTICPGNFFDGPLWSDPKDGLFIQYLESGKVPGAKTIQDVRDYYESMIPMGRGCTCEDLIKAILYLIEQKYETGQALPVTGGQVMLN